VQIGNELFEVVNNWLGWGDPKNGIWFIGMEEGAIFNEENISSRKGRQFDPVKDDENLDWNVATTTAKLVSKLLQHPNPKEYRDTTMWRAGSKVFNGNLLPLGKPKRTDWPEQYKELFGLSYQDYLKYLDYIKTERYKMFKDFREKMTPQAIVCFGKEFWPENENLFVQSSDSGLHYENYGVVVYEADKVILTGHFSYGRWMPNKTIDFVANILKGWGVTLKT
jgi:hypothetical protein